MNSHFKQRSPEWFKQREGRITASLVGAIMGYSPFMSRDDAMLNMLKIGKKFEGNVATEWGNFNEAGAIVEFEMDTGLRVDEAYFVPYLDFLGASPDGYVSDGNLIEIKCPYSLRKGGEFKTIKEQMQYYAQVQMQMLCTNTKACHFYQWAPHGTKHELVLRDKDFIKDMLIETRIFYDEYLQVKRNRENGK